MKLSFLINQLLSPINYAIVFIIILLWLTYKKKNIKTLFLIFISYTLFFTSPLINFFLSRYEHIYQKGEIKSAKSIIILGSGSYYLMENGNRIVGGSFGRILEGILLAKKNPDKLLIISGGEPSPLPKHFYSEAKSVETLCLDLGLNKEQLMIEDQSKNTYEEAKFLKDQISKISPLVLVTDAIHINRSVLTFKRQGFVVIPYPVNYLSSEHKISWQFRLSHFYLWRSFLHELIGVLWYKLNDYA